MISESSGKDRLYAQTQTEIADFVFDERVAAVFPDMIRRSVPGYATIINMVGTLAAQRVEPETRCYDLGCSLGAAALSMRYGAGERACRIIGVDNSLAMLRRARECLRQHSTGAIDLVCADIQDIQIRQASMVVLNFTLQFVPLERRQALLCRIHQGLIPGGILVLSEKVKLPSEAAQRLFVDLHHGFKKAQGYSDLEISQKRAALEKVLLPETLQTHTERLYRSGFDTVEVWFQCFNFLSLLAIKS